MFGKLASATLLAGLWLSVACQEDKPKPQEEPEKPAEAVEEKKPAVDAKIAKAMASVASNRASAPAPGLAPPADGILNATEAQRQAPLGKSGVLVLGSAGGTPRLKLGKASWGLGQEPTGKLSVGGRTAGGVLPNIDVEVVARRMPSTSEVGQVAATASTPTPAALSLTTVVQLLSAVPASQQPGQLPPGADKSIAALNGSTIELVSNRAGAVATITVRPKQKSPEVRPLLDEIAASLATISLPYPNKPVGVGAYWMVTSRENVGGIESVAYRMLRITKIVGTVAEIDVKTRRYLTKPTLAIEGLPPHTIVQFQGEGTGSFSLAVGASFPSKVTLKESMLAMVAPNDRPQQALPLQTDSQVGMTWAATLQAP